MKVLVADKFEKIGLDGLKSLGAEVVYEPDLKEASLLEALQHHEPQVLVVRSTKVTADMVATPSLEVVIRAGAGYNTIDVAAASEHDVAVTNCPGKNAAAVAELAFGLMLACDRRIPDNVAQLREGKWNKKEFGKAQGLQGRTLGLVGFGNISKEVLVRAKAFGMNILVATKNNPEQVGEFGATAVDPIELASKSDVVSVHTSLRPDTKGMVDEAFFAAMKPNAIFINTSRAEVVDQAAMLKAASEKGIRLGLDVFDGEPTSAEGPYDGELKDVPNAYCTHHIGASTEQAQEAVAEEVVRIVKEVQAGNPAPNRVN